MAEVAVRSRRDAETNPYAQLTGSKDVDELLAEPYLADPLRRHDCAPITDGAAVIVLAADDRARELTERPAWITGIAHARRLRAPRRPRPDHVAVDRRGRAARRHRRRRGRRAAHAVHPPGTAAARRAGPGRRRPDHARPAARSPATRCSPAGLVRIGEAARADHVRRGRPGARARDQRPGAAAQPRLRHGGTSEQAAGRGARHRADPPQGEAAGRLDGRAAARGDRPGDGRRAGRLGRHRRGRRRQGAGLLRGRDDARAVPRRRARRGRQAAAARAHRRLGRRLDRRRRGQPGAGRRARAGARGRVGEAVGVERDVGAVDPDPVQHAGRTPAPAATSRRTCAPTSAAPARRATSARSSRRRTGATARRTRTRTCTSPTSRVESVQASQMLWDPIRYDETCPSSDGACAVVIGSERAARGGRPAGVDPRHRDALRADDLRRPRPGQPAGRPRRGGRAVEAGRHHRPARRDRRRRDLRPVLVVRADVAGEPRLHAGGRGLEAHRGRRDRDRRPAADQRSGGVLSSNPIGASAACSASPRPRCR